jgi:putative restriction endonuclease
MIAIIELIEKGLIRNNEILITADLVSAFKNIWSIIAGTDYQPTFYLPFYHLKNDRFWHILPNEGYEKYLSLPGSISSFKKLKEIVFSAKLDDELFQLLSIPETRQEFKYFLLNRYFPDSKRYYLDQSDIDYIEYVDRIENSILHTDIQIIEKLDEEDIFVRGGLFKKLVPKVYDYTCCVSGMRVIATDDIQMVDACHIIPFRISQDDSITNGLSLCPNMHRAFDRGLISIDSNYQLIVSEEFAEESKSVYGITQFESKVIILSKNSAYFPDPQKLEWHKLNKYIGR